MGSKKHFSSYFFFSLSIALKVLPRTAEGHSSKGTEKITAWFFPHKSSYMLNSLENALILFKCCGGRQVANKFCTWVGIQREQ